MTPTRRSPPPAPRPVPRPRPRRPQEAVVAAVVEVKPVPDNIMNDYLDELFGADFVADSGVEEAEPVAAKPGKKVGRFLTEDELNGVWPGFGSQ